MYCFPVPYGLMYVGLMQVVGYMPSAVPAAIVELYAEGYVEGFMTLGEIDDCEYENPEVEEGL